MLIGRLRPGERKRTNFTWRLRTWFVEWIWYRVVTNLGTMLWEENGPVTIALMRALGARVSWTADVVMLAIFSPVEADLIEIEGLAQVSGIAMSCLDATGVYKPVRIGKRAQVGMRTRLGAGVVVEEDAVVGHQTLVPEDSVVRSGSVAFGSSVFSSSGNIDADFRDRGPKTNTYLFGGSIVMLTRVLLLLLFGFVSLIPAYELGVLVFYGKASFFKSRFYRSGYRVRGERLQVWQPPMDRDAALLLVGPIALVAYASISFVLRAWQWLTMGDWKYPSNLSRFPSVVTATYLNYQETSACVYPHVMGLIRGGRLANLYMRFFGATVGETAFINNTYFMEPPLLTIGEEAVVDDGSVNIAHVLAHGRIRFEAKVIEQGAILHPFSITWAGSQVPRGVILGPRAQLAEKTKQGSAAYFPPGSYVQGCPANDYSGEYYKVHGHFPLKSSTSP